MRLPVIALIGLGLLLSASLAMADVIPPPRRVEKDGKVAVWATVRIDSAALKGDDAAAKAKIVIPQDVLDQLTGKDKAGKVGQTPAMGTIIAGIALSLAAVSLLWLWRGKPKQKALMLILAGGLSLGGIGALFADLAPPREFRPAPRPQVVIEVSDRADRVSITLPK